MELFGAPGKLSLTGGTMTGPLALSGTPATALQAAPKGYLDGGFVAVLVYNGTSYPTRPSSAAVVLWIGLVAPSTGAGGAVAGDVWLQRLS